MKILAFGASSSRNSINKAIANYAANLIEEANVALIDLNDYEMPLYSEDKEKENGFPDEAKKFLNQINECDAIIISFAEHNGSYTAAFKNIIDWTSRVKRDFLQDKPMVILSTSPGPGGAKVVLELAKNSMPFFAGRVVGSLSIPSFYENYDQSLSKITDENINQQILSVVKKLIK